MDRQLTDAQFTRELDKVLSLKQRVSSLLKPVAKAYLEFAVGYQRLFVLIAKDPNDERESKAQRILGTTQAQHQRFMAIADKQKFLNQIADALPAGVESLYEIARMANDEGGELRVMDAVQNRRLGPDSTMHSIRLIRTSRGKRWKSPPPISKIRTFELGKFTLRIRARKVPTWEAFLELEQSLTQCLEALDMSGKLECCEEDRDSFKNRLDAFHGLREESAQKPTPERRVQLEAEWEKWFETNVPRSRSNG